MQNNHLPKFFVSILLGVLALWTILSIVGIGLLGIKSGSLAEMGQFGDMFGVLNSLFSALAFAGTVYVIHQQSKQAQEQEKRHEEEKEREEKQFRRIKFEELICDLDAASRSMISLQSDIGIKYLGREAQSLEMFGVIASALAKTRLLARLYFPTLVADFYELRRIQNETCELMHEFCFEGLDQSILKKQINKLAIRITAEHSTAIEIASKHIAIPSEM